MFYFEKEAASPLYQQLYEQLRQQIMEGILPRGRNLPPTRDLAAEYHISRNTVIQAYQQLAVEGYVRSVAGSGYYVEDLSLFQGFYHSEQPERTAHTPSKRVTASLTFIMEIWTITAINQRHGGIVCWTPMTGWQIKTRFPIVTRRGYPNCAGSWRTTCIFPAAFAVVQTRSY